jgi:DNA invertase Pin-like site-specific DNA recombinase
VLNLNKEANKKPIKKVALYIRLAQKGDVEVEIQRELLLDFAKKQGFENCIEYCDNGYHGLNIDRPAFSELNKAIDAGEITAVLMKSISRIARDSFLIHDWLEYVHKKGVKFIAADDSHTPPPFITEVAQIMKKRGIPTRKAATNNFH